LFDGLRATGTPRPYDVFLSAFGGRFTCNLRKSHDLKFDLLRLRLFLDPWRRG
jgi:hypothetical protein